MFNKNCVMMLGLSLFSVAIYSMDDLWSGDDYEKNSEPQYLSALNIIESDIKPLLKGSESILDVGCRTGRTTRRLASLVPSGSAKGIDAPKNMIDYAKQQKMGCDNLSFEIHVNDDSQYDVATSFLCLHWVEEKEKLPVIQAIHHRLKNGGKFIGSIAYGDNTHLMLHSFVEVAQEKQLLNDTEVQKKIDARVKTDDMILYSKLFKEAGFNNIEFKKREEKYYFNGRESFTQWLKLLIKPNLEYFGIDSNQPGLLPDLVDNYLKKIDVERNGIYYILPIIAFKASKAQTLEK